MSSDSSLVGNGLTFASSGIGSVQHLAAELFMRATGTKMILVPYRGSTGAHRSHLGPGEHEFRIAAEYP